MPPSIACNQLLYCSRFEVKVCAGGTQANSNSGRLRLVFRRPHIGPQHAASLNQRIGAQLDAAAETVLLRLRRQVHALAGHVVFPAVIGAAQAAFLVAAEPQRDAAMGAEFLQQSGAAQRVAKRDEFFRQKLHAHRRAVVLGQFLGQQGGNPVAPEHLAHRRRRPRSCQQFVLLLPQHGGLLPWAGAPVDRCISGRGSARPAGSAAHCVRPPRVGRQSGPRNSARRDGATPAEAGSNRATGPARAHHCATVRPGSRDAGPRSGRAETVFTRASAPPRAWPVRSRQVPLLITARHLPPTDANTQAQCVRVSQAGEAAGAQPPGGMVVRLALADRQAAPGQQIRQARLQAVPLERHVACRAHRGKLEPRRPAGL